MDLIICKNDCITLLVNVYDRELHDILSDTFEIISGTFGKCGWHTESSDHTCDCGVYSGVKHKIPQNKAEKDVESFPVTFEYIGQYHKRSTYG